MMRCATTRRWSSSATIVCARTGRSSRSGRCNSKNDGNYEGEAANQPGIGSVLGDYPELLIESRDFPMGRLDDYQQHKVRVWSNYQMSMGRFGSLDMTPMWRYNSALTYSLAAASVPLSAVQRARNPGYARLPGSGTNGSQTLFFASAAARSSRVTAWSIWA